MEENKLKSVWVLTCKTAGCEDREIFGVYTSKDAANDALNDELLLPSFLEIKEQEPNLSDDEIYGQLFEDFDPQVTMCKINY